MCMFVTKLENSMSNKKNIMYNNEKEEKIKYLKFNSILTSNQLTHNISENTTVTLLQLSQCCCPVLIIVATQMRMGSLLNIY